MSAKDKKSEVFSRNQMLISCSKSYYFFEQRAFEHIFAFGLTQMCVFERKHESRLCVLRSLYGLPGQRC